MRLTADPIRSVTHEPIQTHHVYATQLNFHTATIADNPQNIPVRAPAVFARLSKVPSKNNPSRQPKGKEATVKPSSRTLSQRMNTNPSAISTAPHASVIQRERESSVFASCRPAATEKSRMLEAAREFKEPLALDMATATIEASIRPARPSGISRARKRGSTRSVRSPAASSGECCVKT